MIICDFFLAFLNHDDYGRFSVSHLYKQYIKSNDKIFLPPIPRNVFGSCCFDLGHGANIRRQGHGEKMLSVGSDKAWRAFYWETGYPTWECWCGKIYPANVYFRIVSHNSVFPAWFSGDGEVEPSLNRRRPDGYVRRAEWTETDGARE